MVVYFSGTGNSRYCAELLAARLDDELTDAFPFIRGGTAADLYSERPWVFVSPTYAWQLPHVFRDFLRSGRLRGSRTAYFVMTCGDEIGNAGAKIRQLCAQKGFVCRGVLSVVMPENYIAMFDVPDAEESARMVAAARPVLETAAGTIRQDRPFPAGRAGAADRLKTGVVNPLFCALFLRSGPFHATDACVGCGKCVQSCPLGNIRLESGKPVWGSRCTHCMACICGCPSTAIEYGRRSRGRRRYQCVRYRGE